MKKVTLLIALAAMLMAGNSRGSAILWALENKSLYQFTVGSDGSITDGTKYLSGASLYFFLGTTTTEAVASAFDTTSGFDKTKMKSVTFLEESVSNGAGAKAKGNTPVVNAGISSSLVNDFFVVISTKVEDDYYYKVVSGQQIGYETTGDPLPTPTTMQFSASSVQSSSWAAVPEPSTAALALAGLALLLKRRKA